MALLAGLLRLGFLADFISEPVLKGFIVGLALTIIIGQVPKLLGVEKGEGNFFEQLWDLVSAPRRHGRPRSPSASSRSPWCSGCGTSRPWCRARWSPSRSASSPSSSFDLDDHGVAIVGTSRAGCLARAARRGSGDYLDSRPAAIGVMLVGFAEGLGAAKTYAARRTTTSTPTAS